jgi:hypothetical protein
MEWRTMSDNYNPLNTEEYRKLVEEGRKLREEAAARDVKKQPPGLQGWVCPVCGAGLSPFTSVCPCKPLPPLQITCSTSNNYLDRYIKENHITEADYPEVARVTANMSSGLGNLMPLMKEVLGTTEEINKFLNKPVGIWAGRTPTRMLGEGNEEAILDLLEVMKRQEGKQ